MPDQPDGTTIQSKLHWMAGIIGAIALVIGAIVLVIQNVDAAKQAWNSLILGTSTEISLPSKFEFTDFSEKCNAHDGHYIDPQTNVRTKSMTSTTINCRDGLCGIDIRIGGGIYSDVQFKVVDLKHVVKGTLQDNFYSAGNGPVEVVTFVCETGECIREIGSRSPEKEHGYSVKFNDNACVTKLYNHFDGIVNVRK